MPNDIQRIQLTSPISTRSGVLCHDSKIVNAWIETPDQEEFFVTKRYGFKSQDVLSGTSIGQGIFGFGSFHYEIFDDIIYRNSGSPILLPSPTVPDLIFHFIGAPPASGLTGFFLKSTRDAYFYNTVAITVTKVTDPDYPAITVPGVVWLNGRFYVASSAGRIQNSVINDPFNWSALAVIGAVSDGDDPVAITRLRSYVMVLKEFSTEYFTDAGLAPPASPLMRVDSAFVEVGCVAPESVINTETTVFFMGQIKRTIARSVWMAQGYTPIRISTNFIENILYRDNLSNVRAFSYSAKGKHFYILQLFNSERTIVYDADLRTWYIWASKELQSAKSIFTLTRRDDAGVQFVGITTITDVGGHGYEDGDLVIIAGATPSTYNGIFAIRYVTANIFEYILPIDPLADATGTITSQGFNLRAFRPSGYATVADSEFFQDRVNGKIYTSIDTDLDDDGVHIDYRIVTKNNDFGNTNTKTFSRIEPIGDKSLTDSPLFIRHTDDDYRTFSPFRSVILSNIRPQLLSNGSGRRRAFEVRHHDNYSIRLSSLELEFDAQGLT